MFLNIMKVKDLSLLQRYYCDECGTVSNHSAMKELPPCNQHDTIARSVALIGHTFSNKVAPCICSQVNQICGHGEHFTDRAKRRVFARFV